MHRTVYDAAPCPRKLRVFSCSWALSYCLLHVSLLLWCYPPPPPKSPPPGGGRPSLHCIARQYLLQGFVFPICHTHVLALHSHYLQSVTCVYSVIFSLQRRCTGCTRVQPAPKQAGRVAQPGAKPAAKPAACTSASSSSVGATHPMPVMQTEYVQQFKMCYSRTQKFFTIPLDPQ
jgi:hypothetical protein